MPVRPLPPRPSLDHLKHQARDLMRDLRAGRPDAIQRVREFHPRLGGADDARIASAPFALSDAQATLAREHGFRSWTRLKAHVQRPDRPAPNAPHHERIEDPAFRRAVDLIDAGDAGRLRDHLRAHAGLVAQRVTFEGGNYFTHPSLLEFIAENPVRHGRLPANIVEIARAILNAGAREDRTAVDATLALVCSGRVAREAGVQRPLIDLLCDAGADPDAAMLPAIAHGEFDAARALIDRGAREALPAAAAMGRMDAVRRELPRADAAARHLALALAAQHGHAECVRVLLDAGENPDRYNPLGCHSHSTPLHQAALAGHRDVVRALVAHGARLDIEDIHHRGRPVDWARHAGMEEIAAYLEARDRRREAPETGRRAAKRKSARKAQAAASNARGVKWKSRVPWVEKLRPDLKPRRVKAPRSGGWMLVPTPLLLADQIRRVRRGRTTTPARLREAIAKRHRVNAVCPMTTGILLHIVAGAAEEQIAQGKRPLAPWWRVVDDRGRLNPKWPPGASRQAEHLRAEGHRVVRDGEAWVVAGP